MAEKKIDPFDEEAWEEEKRQSKAAQDLKGSALFFAQWASPIYVFWIAYVYSRSYSTSFLVAGAVFVVMLGVHNYIAYTLHERKFFNMLIWQRGSRTPITGTPEILGHKSLPEIKGMSTRLNATYVDLEGPYFDPCIFLHEFVWGEEFGKSFESLSILYKWGLHKVDIADMIGVEIGRSELGLEENGRLPKIYFVGWSGGKAFKAQETAGVFNIPTKDDRESMGKRIDAFESPKLREQNAHLKSEIEIWKDGERDMRDRVADIVEHELGEARAAGKVYKPGGGLLDILGFNTPWKKAIFWSGVIIGSSIAGWFIFRAFGG